MRHAKRIWKITKTFLKEAPKWLGLFLGIIGLFSFNCFILEEAFQTVMFGSWGAFDAKEYRLIKREITTMEGLRTTLRLTNNAGGWMNPFGWYAYQGYVDAEREYIDAQTAKLFAYAPELFDGEKITFTFYSNEMEPGEGYWIHRNGKISVWSLQEKLPQVITGKVSVKDEKVTVDTRSNP